MKQEGLVTQKPLSQYLQMGWALHEHLFQMFTLAFFLWKKSPKSCAKKMPEMASHCIKHALCLKPGLACIVFKLKSQHALA
jgi:hypothetical protein